MSYAIVSLSVLVCIKAGDFSASGCDAGKF